MKRILLCLIVLVSCGSPQGNLADQYRDNSRRLGIIPIYPPREEFQVGDVFFGSYADDPNDAATVWVGEIPEVVNLAEAFMDRRIVFQSSIVRADNKTTIQPDTFGGGLSRRADIQIETLPATAFPSFSADSGYTAGLGITRVLQAIGLAGGARTKVTLNFNDVRTYWVENTEVTRNFGRNELAGKVLTQLAAADDQILVNDLCKEILKARAAGGRPETDFTKRRFGGTLITRVYLTRQISYTYANAQIIAAGLRRAQEGSTVSNIPAPQRVSVNVNASGALETAETDQEIAALRSQLNVLGSNNSQGAGVNFESWNALGISFSQTFPRPVTIGYEAINFDIGVEENSVFDKLAKGDKTICPDITE